ncbi:uncharacterized protein PHALS_06047 [Plasmopara halstedii]|uniref:Uncharacterized protein n=1 Tax=Plasmopara halstedii TaxID=4781 RepID=A0A0P1AC68_PLAHL|nr:uncharacterized protein PHALS_06047 [Plasmopara halstedii]CEG38005.1 hypothetical protein PHALS_06047 [Plasmopara halstedii]|eukprot:XP_024574374.1 hypothetical protein PHALS_06047 [Plasmopara halstedii]
MLTKNLHDSGRRQWPFRDLFANSIDTYVWSWYRFDVECLGDPLRKMLLVLPTVEVMQPLQNEREFEFMDTIRLNVACGLES